MPPLDTATQLAYERNYLSQERTLMGWIRTSLSLITFGFGIAKFFEYLREQSPGHERLLGPKAVGLLMISIGLVSLALASVQHWHAVKDLRRRCPGIQPSVVGVIAPFIALLGILALFSAIFRS